MVVHQAPFFAVDHYKASHILIFEPFDSQSMAALVPDLWHHLQQDVSLDDAQLDCECVVLQSENIASRRLSDRVRNKDGTLEQHDLKKAR